MHALLYLSGLFLLFLEQLLPNANTPLLTDG